MNIYRILPILAIVFVLFSCSAEYYLKKGDNMYESGRFYKSCDYYKVAYGKLKSDEVREDVAIKVGDAYEKVNKLSTASSWYKKSLRYNEENTEVIYKIIEIAHKQGDAEIIEKHLGLYESLEGKNPEVLRNYMENFSNSTNRYRINEFKKLNKTSNDFSPVYEIGDTNVIYFSSTRRKYVRKRFLGRLFKGKVKKDLVTGTDYSNLYRMEYTDMFKYKDKKGKVKVRQLKEPKWMKATMLCDTSVNSRFNEGAVCFNSEGDKMFFTSSRKIGGYNTGTKIYQATKSSVGWGNIRMLNLVPDSVSVGHPALSINGGRLYFVSDMDNGEGGKDIWYSEKSGDTWGQPINAGKSINTKGDEMYPCFRDNGLLYFSSNGHSGLGGLDIFRVDNADGEQVIRNIGYPFNSVADDFGISFKRGLDEGMFSSSRGKRGVDNIYKFRYVPCVYRLTIKTEDFQNGSSVTGVNIKMESKAGKEKNINSGSKEKVSIELGDEDEYLFVVFKDGYLKEKFVISTKGKKEGFSIVKNIGLQPIEKPIELPNILYDLGKWELRDESKKALDILIDVLNENSNIVIELSSHTDMVGSDSDNLVLSQKRAQVIVDYLIEKGIYWDRLVAKGYGESKPKEVTFKDEKECGFLHKGEILTKKYISALDTKTREYANQLNRRTEFKVLRTDYKPGPRSKNPDLAREFGGKVVKSVVVKEKGKELLVKDLKKVKGIIFTLQLGVFNKDRIPEKYKELKVVFFSSLKGKSLCRITHGIFDSYKLAKEYEKQVKLRGFDCFITAFKDGKRIDLKEALKLAEKSN